MNNCVKVKTKTYIKGKRKKNCWEIRENVHDMQMKMKSETEARNNNINNDKTKD